MGDFDWVDITFTLVKFAGGVSLPSAKLPALDELVRRLVMNRHQQVKKREQSMLARMDAEVGLTVEEAVHFRNHIQGYTPYNEWIDYERSHIAMS